jgi:hypothetical protein
MARSRDWRSPPVPPGRSTSVRLLVSIGMLIILGMLILQSADPANWKWLTGEETKRQPVYAEYKVQEGPIDTDPEEWAAAEKGFGLVEDKKSHDTYLNALLKNRYLKWVLRQKPEDLYRRKPATERLGELVNEPSKFRGKLVRFRLNIKRCLPVPSPNKEVADYDNLHEMLGFQDSTGLWIYWLLTPGVPKGFPIGDQIPAQTVDVVGYFHTLRLYQDANEKVYFAPEIVGSAVWYPIEKAPVQPISWPLIIGFLVALPIGVLVLWKMLSGPTTSSVPIRHRAEVDVEQWLEKGPDGSPLDDLDDEGHLPGVNGRSRAD